MLTADTTTGGYDLNGNGVTTDPSGNPVSFTITNAQVDPCGIVTNLAVVYSYSDGVTPSVTNTFGSAYLNLGVVSGQRLTGFQRAATTTWPGGTIAESDTWVANRTGPVMVPAKKKA